MDVNVKYKRWGWGAVIGLIGVILIAGLIVAVSMSSPKPDKDLAASTGDGPSASGVAIGENGGNGTTDTKKQAEEEKKAEEEAKQKAEAEKRAEEEKKAAEEKKAKEEAAKKEEAESATGEEGAGSDSMPHSGPVETFSAFVILAVIAYLVTLNISLVKKQTL
jgi:outer membrane biosynthesis protein TonB